jgi:hypothetical protein
MSPKLLLVLAAASTAAASAASDITPPIGYRQWFHVNSLTVDSASPLFAQLGGLHNIYVNTKGLPGLQKGGPYADGSVFVDDIHAFTVASGVYSEGSRKALSVMIKDAKTYAATGGWGFQLWVGGDAAKPVVTDAATQCFACHTPQKDHDYVFSTYIP